MKLRLVGADISGVFPKGSKKMTLVWIFPGSMWSASLVFCLSFRRVLCSLRGQMRFVWAAPGWGFHQPSLAWERTKASLVYKHSTAVSSCPVRCAPQPYSLVIFSFSSQNKVRFFCLGRGCFLDGITGVEIPAECSSYRSRRKRALNRFIVFCYNF